MIVVEHGKGGDVELVGTRFVVVVDIAGTLVVAGAWEVVVVVEVVQV